MDAWDDMVLVGRIARTQGHRGHVIVNAATDFPERRFAPGARLYARRNGELTALEITLSRMHQGRPVVAFAGVETMTEAEALAGLELRIPESALEPLPEGTYYEHQLAGCDVITTAGVAVGQVARVEGGAGLARLVIGAGREEVQIPLVHEICVAIDVDARRIVIDPPEGLLEVNRTAAP